MLLTCQEEKQSLVSNSTCSDESLRGGTHILSDVLDGLVGGVVHAALGRDAAVLLVAAAAVRRRRDFVYKALLADYVVGASLAPRLALPGRLVLD